MAYYLYKKIRDKQSLGSGRNEAPINRGHDDTEKPNDTSHEPCDTRPSKSERQAMRKYRWTIIAGLFFPCVVQGLNTTMIAAALPFIASDFGRL